MTTLPHAPTGVLMSAAGLAIAISIAIMLWLALPSWTPRWVLETSPWVIPAARAAIACQDETAFLQRMRDQGEGAVRGLRVCLRHPRLELRRLAFRVVADRAQRGTVDPRLMTVVRDARNDPDPQIRAAVRQVLHQPGHSAVERANSPIPAAGMGLEDDDEDDDDDDEGDMAPAVAAPPHPLRRAGRFSPAAVPSHR